MQYHYEILTFLAYMLTLAALMYCSYQIGKTKPAAMEELWSKDEDIIQDDLEPGSRPEFFVEDEVAAGTVQVADSTSDCGYVREDPFFTFEDGKWKALDSEYSNLTTGLPLTKENFEAGMKAVELKKPVKKKSAKLKKAKKKV